MALTKEVKYDQHEIVGDFKFVQCREATIISEDGVVIGRRIHRHVLEPSFVSTNEDGVVEHIDTDISGEPAETQAICNAVWTDEVKAAWIVHQNEQLPPRLAEGDLGLD